jgi:ligand-binding SRPBCC domain-containing protein
MRLHVLERTQRLPMALDEAWAFFTDPRNLAVITPPEMGFEVRSALPGQVYAGMIITYRVRPLLGVPVTWVTEITHVREHEYFVDEQRFGPYRFWHHQHLFREVAGGVEARDIVHYALPPGGGVARRWLVAPKLEQIFDYRRKVLQDRFGRLA